MDLEKSTDMSLNRSADAQLVDTDCIFIIYQPATIFMLAAAFCTIKINKS